MPTVADICGEEKGRFVSIRNWEKICFVVFGRSFDRDVSIRKAAAPGERTSGQVDAESLLRSEIKNREKFAIRKF